MNFPIIAKLCAVYQRLHIIWAATDSIAKLTIKFQDTPVVDDIIFASQLLVQAYKCMLLFKKHKKYGDSFSNEKLTKIYKTMILVNYGEIS